MQYRKLGRTNIEVSAVALGCMSLCANPTYPEIPEEQAIATVHAALDAGINFFDNAPMYGDGVAEVRLGKALKGRRHKAVVATKISSNTLSEAEVFAECDAALQRLGMDYVDLYQIHWPRRVVPLSETLGAMEKLIQVGKVRAIGVCNFGPLDLADAIETRKPVATDQVAYSLLARGPELEVRDLCVEHGIGLLCYSPLAQGLLTGRFTSADDVPAERARTRHFAGTRPQARHGQPGCEAETFAAVQKVREICQHLGQSMADVATAWVIARPVVTSVLTGASRPEQIVQNARAADLRLDDRTIEDLEAATAPVKQKMGPNLDLWQTGSRVR
jgi:aryl-alcohol dehydrogenase-like predicted oxidoreductase